MSQIDAPAAPRPSIAAITFAGFLRVVALACLVAGLKYWIALIGVFDYPPWRFDLMPLHWRIAATSLAVLFPVAATGLWMTVSWGPVIWVAAAGTEVAMYGWFPCLFGHRPLILILHAGVAAIYIAFRIVLHIQRRRRREAVRVDSP